jgi:hypothetical protein
MGTCIREKREREREKRRAYRVMVGRPGGMRLLGRPKNR